MPHAAHCSDCAVEPHEVSTRRDGSRYAVCRRCYGVTELGPSRVEVRFELGFMFQRPKRPTLFDWLKAAWAWLAAPLS